MHFGKLPSMTPPPPPIPTVYQTQQEQPQGTKAVVIAVEQQLSSSNLVNKLLNDIKELQADITALRIDNSALETRLLNYNSYNPSGCMNRHNFNLYMTAVYERPATNHEWHLFCETFNFDFNKFSADVYNWIDTHTNESINSPF